MKRKNKDIAWESIFEKYNIYNHDFDVYPYRITAKQIKKATQHFTITSQKEVRILCKQDTRQSRPQVFQERGLFILPVQNGVYIIIKGEGYINIPSPEYSKEFYTSKLSFRLDTSKVGDSEMQHLDFAYATSLIRSFLEDESLVLTIRGRKYTPQFEFRVGNHTISVRSVQTEVDAGYEGRNQVVLVEAKNVSVSNTIIRQLYYPFRQWQLHTDKKVILIFFECGKDVYSLWQFHFEDKMDYNSIQLVRAGRFTIKEK